jgi:protein involved in polysaccharide export with SLBB domain
MTMYRRIALAIVTLIALTISIAAQTETPAPKDPQKARPRTTSSPEQKDPQKDSKSANGDRLEPDDASRRPSDVPAEVEANRQEQMSEEDGFKNYYNNFFSTYRLGPEDVISVEVFNQDRYSRKGIIIPPNGRVALALIPGGVFVNGKTTAEVAEIIKKRYDEFIIDPEVTVSLDKAMSYRYSVMGDVLQPGVRLMSRRMTVTEALAEAGGVLSTGDRSKVYVLRRTQAGVMDPIQVNVSAIYKGKVPDNTYLVPGDQIVVPGNKMKKVREWLGLASVASFARVFGVPVP